MPADEDDIVRIGRVAGHVAPDVDRIYEGRFDAEDAASKDGVWAEIAAHLQRYVVPGAPVLDVATDRGYFIRHVHAAERWATDIRDVRPHLTADIRFHRVNGPTMASYLPAAYFGTVFMSNYLEHLPNGDVVIQQLRQAYEVLRPGGHVIVLQPNIRLVGGRYWDFIDHKVPINEKSLLEAAQLAGFETVRMVTRFLPFTTKSRLPRARTMVRAYLRIRPAQWLLGKQTLFVGRRPG